MIKQGLGKLKVNITVTVLIYEVVNITFSTVCKKI